jgi:MYXO-CTERM domain-containing protein
VRRVALAAAIVAIAPSVPLPAHANGRFPASNAIYLAPADPTFLVMRTTFGLLYSHDFGAAWDWSCDEALGITSPQSIEDPVLGVTRAGNIVAGLNEGLALTLAPHAGCGWTFVSTAAGDSAPVSLPWIRDVAVRPGAEGTVVALRAPSPFANDAGIAAGTQVYQSSDDGLHWTALGAPIDPSVLPTTLDVAASDPRRLYVAGFREIAVAEGGRTRTGSLFVSMDDGATWIERSVPIDPTVEAAPYIAAVDPSDADRVYLRTEGRSRLLVTTDAGRTFSTAVKFTGQMFGFALSPDGSTVWVGGAAPDGLQMATRTSLTFAPISSIDIACLAARGGDLWACSDELSGFTAGVSHDQGRTFCPVLHLDGVRGPLACPADTPDAGCAMGPVCALLKGCRGSEAGPLGCQPPATSSADPPPPAPASTPRSSSCGCSAAGASGAGVLGALAASGALAAALARRRSRA